ncbi:MAG: hypothetical protein ABR588_03475 [Sphingomicrobium sp.]|nr:hypothetical protein [Sphingomonadales bacterium]
MVRPISALTGLAFAFAPAAAFAASYSATPVVRGAPARVNAADISWACGPDACQGSSEESRPLVLCQDLASRTGRLTSFLVNGSAFTPAELDRCNAKAHGAAPVARAN